MPTNNLPSYRWISRGELSSSSSSPNDDNKIVKHTKLEITPSAQAGSEVIGIGDAVLLCSGDVEADDDMSVDVDDLDSFVARVEDMWEEDGVIGVDEYDDARRARMKIRARWFFKKEDMVTIGGQFTGVSRRSLMSTMKESDLVMGEQTDDNEVSTILGKCIVWRLSPEDGREIPKGVYVCRYDVHIPSKKENGYGSVIIRGVTEEESKRKRSAPSEAEGVVCLSEYFSEKKAKVAAAGPAAVSSSSPVSLSASSRCNNIENGKSTDDEGGEEGDEDGDEDGDEKGDEEADEVASSQTSSSQAVGTGSVTVTGSSQQSQQSGAPSTSKEGSIQIGAKHQAVIPALSSASNLRDCTLVWVPNKLSDEKIDYYIFKASQILKTHMETLDVTPSNTSTPLSREYAIDNLMQTLHTNHYNANKALHVIRSNPDKFLTFWTKKEEDNFNSGFRRYCGSLRMIHKGVETKTHKDVVDYHYRFKIPDQFKKYQDKKREQAKKMMESAERRSNDDGKVWNKLGATEQRRTLAKDFLIRVRDDIGNDKYLMLANCLKAYHSDGCTVPELKVKVMELLKGNEDLLDNFMDFLPKKFRT